MFNTQVYYIWFEGIYLIIINKLKKKNLICIIHKYITYGLRELLYNQRQTKKNISCE